MNVKTFNIELFVKMSGLESSELKEVSLFITFVYVCACGWMDGVCVHRYRPDQWASFYEIWQVGLECLYVQTCLGLHFFRTFIPKTTFKTTKKVYRKLALT